jgi:glycerol transport system ATP-binding protein
VARAFSDPPMNLIAGSSTATGVALPGGLQLARALPTADGAPLTVGVRAGALRVRAREGDLVLPGVVELAEISGSDTFVHVATAVGELVAQLTGVHQFSLGAQISLCLDPAQAYVFDADGTLLVAPTRI